MKHLLESKSLFFITILYTIALFVASLIKISDPSLPVHFNNADKLFHLCAYLILTVLWQWYYFAKTKSTRLKPYLSICVSTIIFGIIIEILQEKLTTYRSFEYLDIVADTVGALLSILILFLFKSKVMEAYLGKNKKNI